ncbi:MAG: TIGR00266 family protein, partial [Candidatus Bathyarchaeum sp.]
MEYEIKYKPSYSMLVVNLEPDESVTAEAGAMTYMAPNINVNTRKREKSILGTLGLALFGGQSFFVNDYQAQNSPAEVAFVAAPVGDIDVLEGKPNQGYIIESASYIASAQNVDLD